ncbi:hypothetical protein DEU56DRAFT_744061 [Suillus clintonianus]|uniref:uncharacterized protein n=1 Tax=Suillus clintonianus TaxID=1904413 RepID=UPI001B8824E9|nr:uncharacterized protein DEU56DRAFT_744061 [Suillus clintonianus]KAG2125087.1 hypothetical protein DEU56DRAFT_744061 [Suillus clintonianus]
MAPAHCPSCGKEFKDHTSVACHMSQPWSGCNNWLDDLIQLNSTLPLTEYDPMVVDNVSNPDVDAPYSYEHGEDVSYYDFGSQREDLDSGGRTRNEDSETKVTDHFPEPPLAFEEGYTFLHLFDADKNSIYRKTNVYYPFSGRREWQFAAWILCSGLSMEKINSLLALEMIDDLPLSFRSARELRGRAESLPSGPHWKLQVIQTSHPTKSPAVLYWRDPLECIATIFNHPLFHNHIDYTARKVYSTAQKPSRIYTEWMTGDHAWEMQSVLPRGTTLLGTILSSDKTCITALSGNHVAHPVLISLANIHMATRLKSSSNAFLLIALLLVTKFIHKNNRMKGMLQDRLVHHCLNVVLQPLKLAAQNGVMLSDPIGRSHYCFTALAKIVHSRAHPDDLEEFFREAQKFCLNGVDKPFWRDWPLAEPSRFFTPESLHHIHKKFWDHDAQWIIRTVGGSEIDFRFLIMQPTTGYRHFHAGISKLKQVTGRCHRDMQRSIIAVSADAAPPGVVVAVHVLMHFNYLVQSPCIDDKDLSRITAALDEFHANKHAIIAAGVRRGKGGKVIDNWQIPKLELMQSIVPSIRNSGVIAQWSADVTEHAHITEVKDPARSSNNHNYDPQICRYLDRADKCNRFDLATSLLDHSEDLGVVGEEIAEEDDEIAEEDDEIDNDANGFPAELLSSSRRPDQPRPITDYFSIAKILQERKIGSVPIPLRSFVVGPTALNLAYNPSIKNATVDEIAIMFSLPDLRPAIADFLHREATYGNGIHSIGGPRRAAHDTELPFDNVQVWFKIRLQETEFHDPRNIRPAQTLNCAPPSDPWTLGRYDTVIIQTSSGHSWPASGLSGHSIAQIRLIIRPLGRSRTQWEWDNQYLTYVQRFDISSECDPTTQLHTLKRAKRSNGTRMGDIIPVSQLRAPVHLVPRFGATADTRLTAYNSMEHATEFWLNYFWDKHSFFALSE